MSKFPAIFIVAVVVLICVLFVVGMTMLWTTPDGDGALPIDAVAVDSYDPEHPLGRLDIAYPFDQSVFPPKIAPTMFHWRDTSNRAKRWRVQIELSGDDAPLALETSQPEWTPSAEQWQAIQAGSLNGTARITILGIADGGKLVSSDAVTISTSPDEVGAPIFYREVNLPFSEAVIDPSRIRWRFGDVASSEPPRVVLENLPVCGNCHSFSADGALLGMDVDYANDKGSYAIVDVAEEMVLKPDNMITWNDYSPEDEEATLGLLSSVAPNGKYVASTVQDDTVFVPRPDLHFSQLFFPIQGIIAIYSREDGTFKPLPGADDPDYVQSNPVWSPDGEWIIFARGKRYREKQGGRITPQEAMVFAQQGRPFLFDLYRVPFNNGKGGKAEPLAGASNNGLSNYFPRYSPDGRWIVFCQAKSYMLLQRDSALYIMPSEGGEPRRLECNTDCMNSWHSWSPNGKWMVFSSKAFSPYTQLFLTHFDGEGRFAPPVLLSTFTQPNRAANIPEFVNVGSNAIVKMQEAFLDDYSYARQGVTCAEFGDVARAQMFLKKALELNPRNAVAKSNLGGIYLMQGRIDEAIQCFHEATAINPDLFAPRYSLGVQMLMMGRMAEALVPLKEAVRIEPDNAQARCYYGLALQEQKQFDEALEQYSHALKSAPHTPIALTQSAFIYATHPNSEARDLKNALDLAQQACRLTNYAAADSLAVLARVYEEAGRPDDAITTARRAITVARASGQEAYARQIELEWRGRL